MPAKKAAKNLTTEADVDAYLVSLPDSTRNALGDLRRVIRAAAPDAQENISYQVPTFNYRGRFLVSFAARDERCSFFVRNLAVMDAHRAELEPFETAGATIHFRPGKPLPAELVAKLVRARIAQTDAGAA